MTEQTGSQATATTQATGTQQTQASTTTQTAQQTSQQTGQQTGQQAQAGQQATTQGNVIWPANWRETIADGDEKEAKRLNRFTDPGALYKWNRELEKWKSSAKLMPELPQNPTPEQIAEYRKTLGVPEEPTKYYDAIKNVVIGEDDRPIVNKFLEKMHAANANPQVVEAALGAFYEIQEAQQSADIDAQKLFKQEQDDILREKWGPDYRTNIGAIRNMFAGMPEDLRDGFESWVDHDGNLLMNNASFLQWVGAVSRDLNPTGTVVPAGQGDNAKSVDARLAEFSEMRRKNIDAWSKNESAQAEERRLLEWKQARNV